MSEQITPEPWLVEKCPCGYPSCERYSTSNGFFRQGNGYSLADATLIAAAPRLLTILQAMVRAGRLGCDAFDFLEAERAIAKALSPTPAMIRGEAK